MSVNVNGNNNKYDHFKLISDDWRVSSEVHTTYRAAEMAKARMMASVTNRPVYIAKCTKDGTTEPDTGVDVAGSLVFTGHGKTGEVLEASKARVERHEAHMESFGLRAPPPVYAPGSLVDQKAAGDRFRISHAEWSKLPLSVKAMAAIGDTVRAERRRDHVVKVNSLRMDTRGFLFRIDGQGAHVGIETNALRQLASRCPEHFPRAGDFLAALDPEPRAHAFNSQVAKIDPGQELMLRMRRVGPDGVPQIFAAVGKSYTPYDIDRVVAGILPGLRDYSEQYEEHNRPRGAAVYDPAEGSLRADIMLHADRIVDAAAGDVFKAGLRVRTSDIGGGAVTAELIAYRNRCLNFIIVGSASVPILRAVHRGRMDRVEVDLNGAIQTVDSFMRGFEKDWGVLRRTPVNRVKIYGESYPDVQTALKALVDQKRIDGVTASSVATEAILTAWKEEPGNTLADLINAVTRYAQKTSEDAKDRIQRAAGDLVPVLVQRAEAAA